MTSGTLRSTLTMLVSIAAVVGVRAQQQPFQAAVDVIVADVQVVGRDGSPITGLTSDAFAVTVDGKPQRVISAEYVGVGGPTAPAASGAAAPAVAPSVAMETGAAGAEGRLYVIAVDTVSFPAPLSVVVMKAAKEFVARLQPNDRVAVFPYPGGTTLEPTTDRAAINAALDAVMGTRPTEGTNRFRLTPSEIIDIAWYDRSGGAFGNDPATETVIRRNCGSTRDGGGATLDIPDVGLAHGCEGQIRLEVRSAVSLYESMANQSIGGLRDLFRAMATIPGRKTMALLTAGMLVADRPGARPDVADLSDFAGKDAARANTTVYTIFVDHRYLEKYRAEARSGDVTEINVFSNMARDRDTMSRWFDRFSGNSGGMMLSDLIGGGTVGFDRILRETSGYYRLGIDGSTVERSTDAQRIAVKVNARNATVRGRTWVIVPPKPN